MDLTKRDVLTALRQRSVKVSWRRLHPVLRYAIAALFLLTTIGILFLVGYRLNSRPTRFESSFETGSVSCRWCNPDGWRIQNTGGQPDAVVVGKEFPQRDGTYSLRIHADKDDPWDPKPRVELSSHAQPFFQVKTEYWVAWSIYLPDDGGYEFDSRPDVFFQIHGLNDDCDAGGMGPPHALRPADGRWRWDLKWDAEQCMGSTAAGRIMIDIGPQELGKWTDFVVRFVFSHEDDGITQVWRDGVLVVDRVGMPNHYNNASGPYMKIGFYNAGWLDHESHVTTRTIYFDAISVYEGTDGYAYVSPEGQIQE